MPLYSICMRVHDRHEYYGGYKNTQFVFASTNGDEKNGMGPGRKAIQTLRYFGELDCDTFARVEYERTVNGLDMKSELKERELMNIILGQCTEQNFQGETLGKDSRYHIKCYNLPSGLWVYDVYRSSQDKQIVITAHKLNEKETSLLSEFDPKNYTHACLTISLSAGNTPKKRTCVMSIHTPEEKYVLMSRNDCHCGATTVELNSRCNYSDADSILIGTIQELYNTSEWPEDIRAKFIEEFEELRGRLETERQAPKQIDRRIVDKLIQDLQQRDSEISTKESTTQMEIQSQSNASKAFCYELSKTYTIDGKSYIVRCNLNSNNAITAVSETSLEDPVSLDITIHSQETDKEEKLISKMFWSNLSREDFRILYDGPNARYDVDVEETKIKTKADSSSVRVSDEGLLSYMHDGITPYHIESVCESVQYFIALTKSLKQEQEETVERLKGTGLSTDRIEEGMAAVEGKMSIEGRPTERG